MHNLVNIESFGTCFVFAMCSTFAVYDRRYCVMDTVFQIGLKAEWRDHQGRVTLFLGNKHVGALNSVRAVILPPVHLRMQLSPVPDTIPPRAQVRF